jgi:hypothetical protein
MTWVLVLYIYAGVFAKGDSVSIATIEGYTSQAVCEQAGVAGEKLVKTSSKEYRFVCVPKK